MWNHSFQQEWQQAYRYADLLCRESRWSKAIYVYQKAAILSMMSAEEVERTGEDLRALFRSVCLQDSFNSTVPDLILVSDQFNARRRFQGLADAGVPLSLNL
ncbi:tetratricopeptide repeat protein 39B-like [Oryzias latipes]